jgi:hypothetical protein
MMLHPTFPASPREQFPSAEQRDRARAAWAAEQRAAPDPRGYRVTGLASDAAGAVVLRPVSPDVYPTLDAAAVARDARDPEGAWDLSVAVNEW